MKANSGKILRFLIIAFLFIFSLPFGGVRAQTDAAERQQRAVSLESAAQKAVLQWNRRAVQEAVEGFEEAAEIWVGIDRRDKAANCLREAGKWSRVLGLSENAARFFKRGISLLEKTDLYDEQAKNYSELSALELFSGKVENSKKYLETAQTLAEQSKNRSAQASASFAAAEYFYTRSELSDSLNSYKTAIRLWNEIQDDSQEANALLYLAYLYLKQNEYAAGFDALNSALAKFQKIEDVRGQALTHKAIGRFYNEINEKQKALESFQKAETLFAADIDYAEKASLCNGIAMVYENFGDFKRAISYSLQAFELFQKEGHFYGQIATLPDLARLSFLTDDFAAAENYLLRGEKLAAIIRDDFYLALIYEQFGNLLFKRQESEKSLAYSQKALKIFRAKSLSRQMSRILTKIGQVYLNRNDPEAARRYFLESLELNKKVKDKLSEAETIYRLSQLADRENKKTEALALIKNSVGITESFYTDILNSKLKTAYLSNVFERYEHYIQLLMKLHAQTPEANFAIEALQASEKSRARLMLENIALAEADFTKDADPQTVRREKEIRILLNNKADKLTDLLSNQTGKAEIDKISLEIGELENELENIKAKLKQESPAYSAIRNPAPFDVADFQRNVLDADSLLLEFSFGNEESYLWLVGKTEVSAHILPPRAEIETHIETLRSLLGDRAVKPDETIEAYQKRAAEAATKYRTEAKELSRKLFGQIAQKFENKRLIIVADGALHYFPVAALPLPNSVADEPILLTNETIYEPSAQTLAVISRNGKTAPRATKDLLVFSDPVFSSDDARFSSNGDSSGKPVAEAAQSEQFRVVESLNNLQRLPASKQESETIIGIVGGARSENYSGFSATRENLLNLKTADYRILHFATHGLTDETRPELSGVALSGFDEKGQKLNQLFRIQDIYALELNAELVVLSACATGTGKHVKGEGLMSLNNAFLQSGAKTVVASLWKVEDAATLELMKHFYEAMANDNQTPAQALRRAQLKLRENPKFSSPFFWAAFTVQGEYRSVPRISGGYGFWTYLLPAVPLALFGFYLYRRRKFAVAKKKNRNDE
jgi:CHAT domain-containing protein